jgi:hypothetical protein
MSAAPLQAAKKHDFLAAKSSSSVFTPLPNLTKRALVSRLSLQAKPVLV